MTKHLESGVFGEQLAVDKLKALGYEILAINWRFKYWEIDIVAKDHGMLVFVEVKSRSGGAYGDPVDFVDGKKQKNLFRAAEAYLEKSQYQGEIRFDIVSVYLKTKKIEIIKDAFWSN